MIAQQFYPGGKEALLQIISDPFLAISYSQFGEDTLIAEFLSANTLVNRPKFYVDIGAYHPSRFSNTKLLRFLGGEELMLILIPIPSNCSKKHAPLILT